MISTSLPIEEVIRAVWNLGRLVYLEAIELPVSVCEVGSVLCRKLGASVWTVVEVRVV
jgi:hypothetical protein